MASAYVSRHQLPSAWETRVPGRYQPAVALLKVDGLKLKYIGAGEDDSQAAAVRTNEPAPEDVPLYYFEVEVLNQGHSGSIAIGFSAEDVPLNKLPGWEQHSYAYHGDDGHAFNAGQKGVPYGPQYTAGDVIGALWNRADRTISYYKNGVEQGVAFRNVQQDRLFPTVGMRSPGEEVKTNFGTEPFRADYCAIVKDFQDGVLSSISAVTLPGCSGVGSLSEMVFEYLVHNRCWQTAQVVAKDLLGDAAKLSPEQIKDIIRRKKMHSAVVEGSIDEVFTAAHEAYGDSLWESFPHIAFRLKCQKFIEMVRSKQGDTASIAYARNNLTTSVAEEQELLQDALTLLAYVDPETSPSGHLLGLAHRQHLADDLNCAILQHKGERSRCALDQAYRQLEVCKGQLKQVGNTRISVVDVQELLFGG